ncbi:hypothetical protein IGK51_002160 [Enterococcus sp. DIV0098]
MSTAIVADQLTKEIGGKKIVNQLSFSVKKRARNSYAKLLLLRQRKSTQRFKIKSFAKLNIDYPICLFNKE